MTTNGLNQQGQKERNLSIIINRILREKGCTRAGLAREIGLTPAAVGKLTSELISWGMVEETESNTSGRGRNPIQLRINEEYQAIAIRINIGYVKFAVYNMGGQNLYYNNIITPNKLSPTETLNLINSEIEDIIFNKHFCPICIGVAVIGPFNCNTGTIAEISGLSGWGKINIKEELSRHFNIPVFVEHDANCGAMAELMYGDYPLNCNMLFVASDRGTGAGIIINGAIYRGFLGYAGEIGHASINVFGEKCECGNNGCMEIYGSVLALQKAYRRRLFNPLKGVPKESDYSIDHILRLVNNGDPIAQQEYINAVSYMTFGVASIIHILNPEYVVFADSITKGGSLFLETVNTTLQKYLEDELYNNTKIKVCALEGDPMLAGAAVNAFEHLMRTPTAFFKR